MAFSPVISLSSNDITSTNDTGTLQAILTVLIAINSRLPYPDPGTQRMRVQIESELAGFTLPVALAGSQSTNVAQINAVAALTGPGTTLGGAALRVAPGNDTLAGQPAQLPPPNLYTIYSGIVTS